MINLIKRLLGIKKISFIRNGKEHSETVKYTREGIRFIEHDNKDFFLEGGILISNDFEIIKYREN